MKYCIMATQQNVSPSLSWITESDIEESIKFWETQIKSKSVVLYDKIKMITLPVLEEKICIDSIDPDKCTLKDFNFHVCCYHYL